MASRRNLAVLAAVLAVGAGALWYLMREREIGGAREMVGCLPRNGATLVYVDMNGLRQSGILDLIAGSKAAEDPEYRRFVDSTQFDYRRDLHQIAGALSTGEAMFLVEGNFDWAKLDAYAIAQGGTCKDNFCSLRGSEAGRWISFYKVRPRNLAIAFSTNQFAALDVAPRKMPERVSFPAPAAPVWAWVPAASLEGAKLPPGAQSFTSPLANAESIVFSIGQRDRGLEMAVDVTCANAAAASDLLVKLEEATNMLRKLIEREHQQPNPRDLSGLLTAGAFRREDRKVYGAWPLHKEFVEALASGAVN